MQRARLLARATSWKARRVQISDWRLLPLTPAQAQYAAMDAWAGAAISYSLAEAGVLDQGLARALSVGTDKLAAERSAAATR